MKPVSVSEIKAGDELYEYCQGSTIALVASQDARPVIDRPGWADGWECRCTRDDGRGAVLLFASGEGSAYSPQLYFRKDWDSR